jgi:hypothetical protein
MRYDPAQFLPEIHAWIESGKTLRAYCRQEGKPSYGLVYDWLEEDAKKEDAPESSRFARARDIGEAVILQECLEIADEQQLGEIVTEKPYTFEGAVVKENGQTVILREIKQADMIEHRKLRIETRLKLLAKWNPKKYGERVQNEHTGADGGPLKVLHIGSDGE